MRGVEQIPWIYDGFMAIVERLGLGRWRRLLVGGARGRTLDLGCGTGRNLSLFRDEVQVIGLELDLRLLAAARRRAPRLPLVVGRAEALPFRDRSFDTVLSSLVFCSVARPRAGLAEAARVLASTGQLRMLEHVRSDRPWLAWLQDRMQPGWTWLAGGCHPNRRTVATVEAAGFVIDRNAAPGRATLRCFSAHVAERSSAAE